MCILEVQALKNGFLEGLLADVALLDGSVASLLDPIFLMCQQPVLAYLLCLLDYGFHVYYIKLL